MAKMTDEELTLSMEAAKKKSPSAKWSGEVTKKEKWHPPKGFFEQSATKIAKGLKKESDSHRQAMSRLNFYINRAGKNLSRDDKERLENAKDELKKLYEKDDKEKKD